jgi:hypothetical protein
MAFLCALRWVFRPFVGKMREVDWSEREGQIKGVGLGALFRVFFTLGYGGYLVGPRLC